MTDQETIEQLRAELDTAKQQLHQVCGESALFEDDIAQLRTRLAETEASIETFCQEMSRMFGEDILRLGDAACFMGMQASKISTLTDRLATADRQLEAWKNGWAFHGGRADALSQCLDALERTKGGDEPCPSSITPLGCNAAPASDPLVAATPSQSGGYAYHRDDDDELSKAFFRGLDLGAAELAKVAAERDEALVARAVNDTAASQLLDAWNESYTLRAERNELRAGLERCVPIIEQMDSLLGTCHAVLLQVAGWDARWSGTAKYQAGTTANTVREQMAALNPSATLAAARELLEGGK